MRRKRSRFADEAAKRHKSAKRQVKHKHRFIQHSGKGSAHYYEDIVTGQAYPGEMPKVLKAYRVQETP